MEQDKRLFDRADMLLIAVVLLFVLLKVITCNDGDPVIQNPSSEIARRDDSISAVIKSKVDSAGKIADSLASVAADLESQRNVLRALADRRKKQADTYIEMYLEAKAALDTASAIAACDTIVSEYNLSIQQWEREAILSDSIISVQKEALAVKDSQIYHFWYLVSVKDSSINRLVLANNDLHKRASKAILKERRKARAAWIGAAAAFVLGVLVSK